MKKIIIFITILILLLTACADNTEKNTDINSDQFINNSNQKLPEVIEVNLPIAIRDQGNFKGAFTVSGDYFYYEGDKGAIYQASIKNPNNKTIVYELPLWTYGDSYVYPNLETINDTVFLTYHQGGAVMGSDHKIILYEDGTNEEYSAGYYNKKIIGDYDIYVSHYVPPSKGNLAIKTVGDKDYTYIGLSEYYYGWIVYYGSGFGQNEDLYLIDENIYILATYDYNEEKGTTGIHKVNIKTGETTRLCEESAKKFIIEDDCIYFVDMEGYLYKLLIGQSISEKLLDKPINDFVVLNHQVYYISKENSELFKLDNNESLNPGGIIKSLKIEDGYVISTFEENGSSPLKLIIINDIGNIVFKTENEISHISVNNDKIYYIK